MFPVDNIIQSEDVTVDKLKESNLCLSKDRDTAERMLHLFNHIPPEEITADLKEMGLNGLACVGVDGTCLAADEIKSERYVELIKACRKEGILFIHGFPFADTYDNKLTRRYPHIKQKNIAGKSPCVGWDKEKGHLNIDYGSEEFIDFCRECIDILKELDVEIIDYAEPDHYPLPDNGYGESLAKDWKEKTGKEPPYPSTLEHRRFMEDRNIEGISKIGAYARTRGFADHLTASPLFHSGYYICQNLGKYGKTDISELSTTYHTSFSNAIISKIKAELDLCLQSWRPDGIGCIEAKSMRDWKERHAVYIGCGQGVPLVRFEGMLNTSVLLYQMDLCFWDYGNFRNKSMYSQYHCFEDPGSKYRQFKTLVRSAIDSYADLPQDYKEAAISPDALILYAKTSDYNKFINKEPEGLSGAQSLYSIAFKLQTADIPFMFIYDEYPEILERDGKEVPLLIIDGYQEISPAFTEAAMNWFGKGKIIFVGGELSENSKKLIDLFADKTGKNHPGETINREAARNKEYTDSIPSIKRDSWHDLLCSAGKTIVSVKGNAAEGILLYSTVPISRLYQEDIKAISQIVLGLTGKSGEMFSGNIQREIVRYKNGSRKYVAIKNQGDTEGTLRIITEEEPKAYYPRSNEVFVSKEDGKYQLELKFGLNEVRIVEYEEDQSENH